MTLLNEIRTEFKRSIEVYFQPLNIFWSWASTNRKALLVFALVFAAIVYICWHIYGTLLRFGLSTEDIRAALLILSGTVVAGVAATSVTTSRRSLFIRAALVPVVIGGCTIVAYGFSLSDRPLHSVFLVAVGLGTVIGATGSRGGDA